MKMYVKGYTIKNEDSHFQEEIDVELESNLKQVCVATSCGGELSLNFEEWEAVKEAVTKLFIQNGESE